MSRRADLDDVGLTGLAIGAAGSIAVWAALLPDLPAPWHRPGSALLHAIGIAGALLLLISAGFVIGKRAGRGPGPVRWFSIHVVCACAGTVLVTVHTAGGVLEAPGLLLLALLALALLGTWARLRLARTIAASFATKIGGFAPPSPQRVAALRQIIERKGRLLPALEAGASEATFSVSLRHWLRHPRLAMDYARLAAHEARLMGQRRSVAPAQAWWRLLHVLLALVFTLGLLVHVLTVTFFAGWVAEGRAIDWWHLAAW